MTEKFQKFCLLLHECVYVCLMVVARARMQLEEPRIMHSAGNHHHHSSENYARVNS